MLLAKYVEAEQSLSTPSLARCEACWMLGMFPSSVLRQASVILEQVRDPKIAFMKFIGCCEFHYPPALAKAYVEHGWVVRQ